MKNTGTKLTLAKAANKTRLIIMWIITICSALMTIGGVATFNTQNIFGSLVVILGFGAIAFFGITKIIKLRTQKAALKNYTGYIARLSNDPPKSLSRLATPFNLSTDTVVKHINALIKLGLIQNAYVENDRLILPERNLYEKAPETVYVTMKCACCGANTTVPEGKSNTCEYCGSPLTK